MASGSALLLQRWRLPWPSRSIVAARRPRDVQPAVPDRAGTPVAPQVTTSAAGSNDQRGTPSCTSADDAPSYSGRRPVFSCRLRAGVLSNCNCRKRSRGDARRQRFSGTRPATAPLSSRPRVQGSTIELRPSSSKPRGENTSREEPRLVGARAKHASSSLTAATITPAPTARRRHLARQAPVGLPAGLSTAARYGTRL